MLSHIRSSVTGRLLVGATAGGATLLAVTGCSLLSPDVLQLQVGDCLADEDLARLVEDVEPVSCDEPHNYEVYAAVELEDGDFPGNEVLEEESQICETEFEAFIGVPYLESEIFALPLIPTEESWQIGDREIVCLAYEPDLETEGSLAGVGR